MDNISLNRVELRGRIGQDPKITDAGGAKVARFSVATSEIFKDRNGVIQEDTTWHNVSVWSGKSNVDFSQLKKGTLVSVFGKIRTTKYTNGEGNDRYYTEIVASSVTVPAPPFDNAPWPPADN